MYTMYGGPDRYEARRASRFFIRNIGHRNELLAARCAAKTARKRQCRWWYLYEGRRRVRKGFIEIPYSDGSIDDDDFPEDD